MGRYGGASDFFSTFFKRGGKSADDLAGAKRGVGAMGGSPSTSRAFAEQTINGVPASKLQKVETPEQVEDLVGGKTLNNQTPGVIIVRQDVTDAVKSNKAKLAKMGIKGAAGVAALMILTGQNNPVKAIEDAYNSARDVAGVFGDLLDFFIEYGFFICLSCSCCFMLLIMLMLLV